jgi:DNA-directed RNA polymerase III subunit RPC1
VTLGGGNKSGLFQVLNTDYSPRVAAECMNRLAKLRWVAAAGGLCFELSACVVLPV